jgi:hypothetical protein
MPQHYSGWTTDDPSPLSRDHKIVPLDSKYTADLKDPSIPRDRETFNSAERVLESLSLIGELPGSCSGPGCKSSFRGSLWESRVTLFIQAGDGQLARPLTYCPQCFESLYRKSLKVECDTRADEIWRLASQGMKQAKIAEEIGVSQQTVSNVLKEIRSRRKSKPTIN